MPISVLCCSHDMNVLKPQLAKSARKLPSTQTSHYLLVDISSHCNLQPRCYKDMSERAGHTRANWSAQDGHTEIRTHIHLQTKVKCMPA